MAKKNDVVGLAKTTAKKPAARKPAAKKPAAKPVAKPEPTKEELRDQKAKETVSKLLADSPITKLEKKDELLELDEVVEEPKGLEWLEEQVTLLNQKNQDLSAELEVFKIENQQLRAGTGISKNDGDVKKVVIDLFNELQENFIRMGIDSQGMGNFRIYTPGVLNRMIKFFPFLEEVKRY